MSETKVPAIPAPTDANLRDVARAIKGVIDVREGLAGDPLDANITFRDLVDGGVVSVSTVRRGSANAVVITGPVAGGSDGYDPTTDLTTPPVPTGFTVTGGLTSIFLEWDAPPEIYANHAYTEIWRAEPTFTNTTPPVEVAPVIGNAFRVGTTIASVYSDSVGRTGTTRYYWIRFVSQANVNGPYNSTNGTSAATGKIGNVDLNPLIVEAGNLAAGSVTAAKFVSGIEPVGIVTGALPTDKTTSTIFLASNGKLYRWDGTAYVASVPAADLIGQIGTNQIADATLTTAKFASGIEPVTIVTGSSLPTTKSTSTIFLAGTGKLYRWDGSAYVATVATSDLSGTISDAQIAGLAASKVTGQLNDSQIADVAAAKLTGSISSSQIADGSISGSKFASSLEPVTIVSSVPTTKGTSAIFNTANGKLYRWDGTAYVATVATADLSGTISDAQIADLAATKVTGQLTNSQIESIAAAKVSGLLTNAQIADLAATKVTGQLSNTQIADVAAAKLTGEITGTQISNDAISAPKLAAGAITTAKIAAGAVTADTIAANAITSAKIEAGAITTAKIAAGAVTADTIAANAITSAKIEAGAITTAKIAAGAVTAGEIAAGAITATEIAAGAITTAKIAAGAVTANEIAAGAITTGKLAALAVTAAELAANSVTAGKINAGAVSAAELAAGAVTADKLAANAVTAVKIDAGAVTTAKLAAGAVTADTIAANAITSAKIEAGAVTTAKIAAGAIDATTIAASAITGDKIAAGTITSTNLAADTITAGQIAAGAISASELAAGAVTTAKLAAGAVTADKIEANTITAGQIAAGAITATKIAANAIAVGTAAIENGAIVNAMLGAATIETAKIADAAITTAKIADAAITNAKISGTIQSDNYSAGTAGWAISKASGFAEFGAASIRGQLTASQINSNGLSIRDASGNIILNAGATVSASTFLGNVTGTVNYIAAATLTSNADNGNSAWAKFSGVGNTLPSGNVEFNFAGSSSKGGNATNTDSVGGQTAAVVASATTNFNTRNDRKSTTPASPTVLTDGTAVDHVLNTDGAADVSFEWTYLPASTGDAYDIDGFLVYVRQGTTNAAYTFGTTPADEVVYTIAADRRAFILYGVPADRYYTFGVRAYRIVDPDVSSGGILQSAIVKATAAGENPYQPSSSVAFAGNVSGTVNNVAGSTLTTAATNFNARNDRNSTAVVAPVVANDVGTLDHTINSDGSADVSFEWTWSGTESDIDGFIVYVHDNGTSAPSSQRVIDGSANALETVYYVTPQRRAFILYGLAADHYYTFGVQAYRIVDPDISATGVLRSAVAQPASNATETTLGAYRPSANVAFTGNVTGTVNNVAVTTLTSNAANGNAAWNKFSGVGNTLPSGNVEFNFAGSSSKGGNASNTDNVAGQTAAVVASATSNFNNRNDRKSTTPAAPTILTDGTAVDHVINTDGAADVSFEWGFTGTGDAYDIDGFLVYVRQGATNSVYAFGTTPAEEVVYTVASDRRAFILYGVPADKHYTFGVRAYRIVDQDVSASGIVQSAIVKATATGENPYQPSALVAFAGNVSGTVNDVAGSTLTTAATNFNNRNDRIATAVVAPVVANAAGTLDHVTNTDGSADISFEWTWGGTESQIDGFIVFVHDNGTTTPTAQRVIDGAANASETVYYLTPQRRAFILTGAAADHWYTFGVRAYRIVDPDISATGVLNSSIVQPLSGATETTFGAYRPSSNVSFAGNVTGTVADIAAGTVATGAANGTTAINAINNGSTGLATKLANNARNALSGSGGLAAGTLQWDTSGVRTSGYGVGFTANGLAGYNSSGAVTFAISAADGSATFAGDLSAATGSFTGAVYGGSYTSSFAWPSAGTPSAPNNGFHLSSGGLMLGNYNTLYGTAPNQYRKFFLVEANGDVQAPGFTIINGTATFSGTVSANVINTEAIIGGAASTGAVTTTTAASASITITVPTGASAVLIQYYLGPDTVTYTGGSGKDGGGSYTYGPILTGLTATPAGGSPSTTSVIIVGPTAGTYTITATRSYYTGTMRLGAVVLKR